jgi:hypothetical protein
MKTNDLIAMLSTNTEPVDRNLVIRTVCIALAAGPWWLLPARSSV